jgi:hypothetical protein
MGWRRKTGQRDGEGEAEGMEEGEDAVGAGLVCWQ